jgi:CxxC-x17-CxxC domain-containing protein
MRKDMSYTDQTLYCRDCNEAFTFTAGEQEFFASRGLTNTPARCPSCRTARKAQRGDRPRSGGGRNDSFQGQRQMYSVTCASCGNEAQVPFRPSEDRPVYCSDCFQVQSSGRRNDRRSRW